MTIQHNIELFGSLPSHVQAKATQYFNHPDFSGHLDASQYQDLLADSGLNDTQLKLALLPLAASHSYCPISDFHVGAIAEGLSGAIYFGGNLEFSGTQLGQTVHAEQSSISHAWMKGETGIKNITINHSPCGHCRQFMNELTSANDLIIQLPQRPAMSLAQLLPDSFGPGDLEEPRRLMDQNKQSHSAPEVTPLMQAAVDALNMSHAPYSNNYSGVSLQVTSGAIFNGSYAENAAFNPSLPPLQVAINLLLLAGHSLDTIEAACLAEIADGSISHLADTQATLEAINPDITLEYAAL
ncbi:MULTISPECIES: cytidine deaminase [Vibrio]|uniref:Cytidine deaminase n=1 Tax=Vibrio algicola TaxID=2662262 RepID=A0A5Q0TDW9_9VIBR|nr:MULTISPECIES: cytidine deaminase [Vibrio]MBD1575668.1 cytidine deaminase [Vibrio sp. S11_S32]